MELELQECAIVQLVLSCAGRGFLDDGFLVGLLHELCVQDKYIRSRRATPLHFATKYDCTRLAKALLRVGAAVDARDVAWRMPLHLASRHGALSVA